MARRGEQLVDARRLDHPARVHHRDPVGHPGDHPEVVADQDERGAGLAAGGAQHVEHLGLDGDVQGGGGFVGEQHVGVVGDGHGDHGALPHAAGELVREAVEGTVGGRYADQVEQFGGPLAGGGAVEAGPVDPQRLDELVADPVDGGEGGERVLEHHGDPSAADGGQLASGQADQLAVVQPDRAPDPGGAGQQAEHGQRGDGLPGAGLADDAEGLAPVQGEVDAAHGGDGVGAARAGEVDPQVADAQQRGPGGDGRGGGGHALVPFLVARARVRDRRGRRAPSEVGSSASRSPSPIRLTARTKSTSSPAAK